MAFQRGPGPGGGGLLVLVLLWLAPCCSGAAAFQTVVEIYTPQQFLEAFAAVAASDAPKTWTLELHRSIALTPAQAANYSLPFVVGNGTALTMRAAGQEMLNLDLGLIPSLLYFKAGSSYTLLRLNASGSADPQLGTWPVGIDSPTVIQSLPFWPTVGADAGFTVWVYDCNITLYPTELCTPPVFKAQFDALRQLAEASGTGLSNLTSEGTTAYFGSWSAPIPVLSAATKVSVGTVMCSASNTQLHCSLPASATASGALVPLPLPINGSNTSGGNSSNDDSGAAAPSSSSSSNSSSAGSNTDDGGAAAPGSSSNSNSSSAGSNSDDSGAAAPSNSSSGGSNTDGSSAVAPSSSSIAGSNTDGSSAAAPSSSSSNSSDGGIFGGSLGGLVNDGNSSSVDSSNDGNGAAAPSTSTSSSSSDGEGGSSLAGWVWGLVSVAAALTVASAAAAALLWRRRHAAHHKLQEQQLHGVTVAEPAQQQGSGQLSQDNGTDKLECMGSGSLPSPGDSPVLEPAASKLAVPEGPWRSRVGFIEGLQLGGLIGRGGYARVYKGRWQGTMVAVKVAETVVGPQQRYDLRDEPLLSLSLSHPNVLQGYRMCAVKVLTDSSEGSSAAALQRSGSAGTNGDANSSKSDSRSSRGRSGGMGRVVPHLLDANCLVEVMPPDAVLEPGMYEMWLVSELADKGTLADASRAGRFCRKDPPGHNLQSIVLCLLDIARGLEYLHSCNIVHGDLKPQNVLLKTAPADSRGFVCKLGDFGLSRLLRETETHIDTRSYGTVTHAAPELLKESRLTKASDIYAFAMVLWELMAGEPPYSDMHNMQIIIQVTQHAHRPAIPHDCPPLLASLLTRCWAEDPAARPTARAIVQTLISIHASLSAPSAQKQGAVSSINGTGSAPNSGTS